MGRTSSLNMWPNPAKGTPLDPTGIYSLIAIGLMFSALSIIVGALILLRKTVPLLLSLSTLAALLVRILIENSFIYNSYQDRSCLTAHIESCPYIADDLRLISYLICQ